MTTLIDPVATHQRLLLAAALRTEGPMLELGAGYYSTRLLHEVASVQERVLYTLDTDPAWLSRFVPSDLPPSPRHKLYTVPDWDNSLPTLREGRWGLVFVDLAPPLARGEMVKRLRDCTYVFVLHDTEAHDAYGYTNLLSGPSAFRYQVTDRAHWTWTTLASDAVDVTRWGIEEFPQEEPSRSVAHYLMRVFPGKNHYFVEAGAHNGVLYPHGGSATWELEEAGWDGLCVEPSSYYTYLVKNRRCRTDHRVLGRTDGELVVFRQIRGDHVELSGIVSHLPADHHRGQRESLPFDERVERTVRLSTMLAEHGAPPRPAFLCLDTEGSELAILRGHDFAAYRFGVIFVEYNGVAERRQELVDLLERQGYVRSRGRGWDDGQNLTFIDRGVSG